MNKFKVISEFEDLLKENLQSHSTPAPPEVWSNVATSTAQSAGLFSQASSFLSSTTNLLKVALFAGGIAAVGIVVYNENKTTDSDLAMPKVEEAIENTTISTEQNNPSTYTEEELNTIEQASIENIREEKDEANATVPKIIERTLKTNSTNEDRVTTKVINQPKGDDIVASDPVIETSTPSSFDISNTKPCKGETITLSQAKPTTWSINDVVVSENSKTHTFVVEKQGLYVLSNNSVSKTIEVQHLDLEIAIKEEERGQFTGTLPADLIGNWYLDGKLIATNENKVSVDIEEVGDHTLKSTAVNHTCNATATQTLTLKPIGKITFYTIFTPDGDGKNDTYEVAISGYQNFSIQIYNKQNQRVFVSQNPDNKWNGRIQNEGPLCAEGEYTAKISYKLEGEAPQVKSIRLTLKR